MDFTNANRKLTAGRSLPNDAASSSSGLPQPKPSYASVVASDKCASNSNKALLENIERVISSTRHTVGGIVQMDEVGRKKTGKPQLVLFDPLSVNEDEIKSERPGSDSGYWKEKYEIEKEKNATEKKLYAHKVELRQDLARYEKTTAGEIADARLKEKVLMLKEAKNDKFGMILAHASYTTTLRMIHFQRANMDVKLEDFGSRRWRKDNRFPTFKNNSAKYKWWQQNFDREILEKRLKILRVASDNYDQDLDMYSIITFVSDFNSELHPPPKENEGTETDADKMRRHVTVIRSLLSSGGTEI